MSAMEFTRFLGFGIPIANDNQQARQDVELKAWTGAADHG
jgi:hypothetical protein